MYRLKEIRKERGLSQKELAEKLGCGQNTISMWESGKRIMDSAALAEVADFFGVTTDYLLCKESSRPTLGDNIRFLRKSKGLKQEDLANVLGSCRSTVGQWEIGANTPPIDAIVQIADFFGVSLDDMLSRPLNDGPAVISEKNIATEEQSARLLSYFDKLNDVGKREAIIRILELCLCQDYLKTSE